MNIEPIRNIFTMQWMYNIAMLPIVIFVTMSVAKKINKKLEKIIKEEK